VLPLTEYAGLEPPYEKVAFAEGDLENPRVTVGLRLRRQEADFSKLIIFLFLNKNIKIYEIITPAIVTTFWAIGRTFLITGTTFFKNLILASGFESLKDSVVGFSIFYVIF
jgi:hypothetical protein